jgi:hypothetical protein
MLELSGLHRPHIWLVAARPESVQKKFEKNFAPRNGPFEASHYAAR